MEEDNGFKKIKQIIKEFGDKISEIARTESDRYAEISEEDQNDEEYDENLANVNF